VLCWRPLVNLVFLSGPRRPRGPCYICDAFSTPGYSSLAYRRQQLQAGAQPCDLSLSTRHPAAYRALHRAEAVLATPGTRGAAVAASFHTWAANQLLASRHRIAGKLFGGCRMPKVLLPPGSSSYSFPGPKIKGPKKTSPDGGAPIAPQFLVRQGSFFGPCTKASENREPQIVVLHSTPVVAKVNRKM
jgi:hypothetical protein